MAHSHHHHNHQHEHSHIHSHGNRLAATVVLNIIITIAEFVGGIVSGSLALISDAFHNLSDSLSIIIAWIAARISKKESNQQKTFGYHRAEILAALLNSATLIGICIFLIFEAYQRFLHPQQIDGKLVIVVACIGLIANVLSVFLLKANKSENLNIRAAYLHMLGDALSSVAVIIGAILIQVYQLWWIDPLITIFISIYIMYHTFHLLSDTVSILMQSAPEGIEIQNIKDEIERLDGIDNLHHIHIWSLNEKEIHFEAHIDLSENKRINEVDLLRAKVEDLLTRKFNISHTTLQFEFDTCCNKDILGEKNNKQ